MGEPAPLAHLDSADQPRKERDSRYEQGERRERQDESISIHELNSLI